MQKTSESWKANQDLPVTSEGFVELSYKVTDPDLSVASMEDNGALEPFSETSKTMDEVDHLVVPYATLEQDLWLLDGSKATVPEDSIDGYSGYISNLLCAGNGGFNPAPCIRIKFTDVIGILPGLTITWGVAHGDYPTKFQVTTYKDGIYRQCKEVGNNEDVLSIVEFEMEDFDEVAIAILEWGRPYRRARIGKIFMGINKVYTKSDLLKFSCSAEVDPISGRLPKYEVQFEVDNIDAAFNPAKPDGFSTYMMERQEIRARYGFQLENGIEWIPGGVYYLSDWSSPQNGLSASFKARDLLGFLNAPYYKGSFAPDEISLFELAKEVLLEARFPKRRDGEDPWVLDEEALRSVKTTAPLPSCSLGECLQLIANAACCAIFFDEEGKLRIKPLGDPCEGHEVNERNSYAKAEINLTKPIRHVDVSKYHYAAEEASKELHNGIHALKPGKNVFIIGYSDMAMDVVADISLDGVAIEADMETESFAQNCRLVIWHDGDGLSDCRVSLKGRVVKPTEAIITVNSPDGRTLSDDQNKGEVQQLKNSLITDEARARAVGGWAYAHLSNRKRASLNWRADPALETLDVAEVCQGQEKIRLRATATSLDYTGAFKGKIEGMVEA